MTVSMSRLSAAWANRGNNARRCSRSVSTRQSATKAPTPVMPRTAAPARSPLDGTRSQTHTTPVAPRRHVTTSGSEDSKGIDHRRTKQVDPSFRALRQGGRHWWEMTKQEKNDDWECRLKKAAEVGFDPRLVALHLQQGPRLSNRWGPPQTIDSALPPDAIRRLIQRVVRAAARISGCPAQTDTPSEIGRDRPRHRLLGFRDSGLDRTRNHECVVEPQAAVG